MPLGYFTDSTPLTPLRDPFNVLVDAVNVNEVAIGNRQLQTFYWATATDQTNQAGMVEGDIGYRVDLNQYLYYDGSSWRQLAGNMPAFSYSGTQTSVASGTETTMTSAPTSDFTAVGVTIASGVVTIPTVSIGLWLITGFAQVQAPGASSYIDLFVTRNGTASGNRVAQGHGAGNSSAFASASCSKLVMIAANDQLRLRVLQATGSAASINWEFGGTWIGPGA